MQNYKTNYTQIAEILWKLSNGSTVADIQEFQGYMRVTLADKKEVFSGDPILEYTEFDFEMI